MAAHASHRVLFPFHRPAGGKTLARRTQPPRAVRPALEQLENRSLPSIFTVTGLGDAGIGSGLAGDLRYCINQANFNAELSNQIQFEPGLTGTITLTQGVLPITKNLEITGPGQSALTVSGNHQSGVFNIPDDSAAQDVQISDLTIADGTGVPGAAGQAGGGLYDAHATVTLRRVSVTGNSVVSPGRFPEGGGIYTDTGTIVLNNSDVSGNAAGDSGSGGGIFDNRGTLELNSSTISGNHVGLEGTGGGIGTSGSFSLGPVTLNSCTVTGNSVDGSGLGPGGLGGAIIASTQLTINNSVIVDNSAGFLGGGFYNLAGTILVTDTSVSGNFAPRGGGGFYDNNGRVTLTDSTMADNQTRLTDGFGGAIGGNGQITLSGCTLSGNSAYDGGAIARGSGDMHLTNCTISGNIAAEGGGGIYANQGNIGTTELTSVTITDNTAEGTTGFERGGGGMWLYPPTGTNPNRVYMNNTIVAGNSSASTGPDVNGTVLSLGYNLIGQTDDSHGWVSTDLTGTSDNPLDPQLGPLQDNGGPTLTHALLAGSPALNHGDFAQFASLDQRGTQRLDGDFPDIGAFEAERLVNLRLTAPSQATAGQPFEVTVTAVDQQGNTASTFVGTVHFTSTDLAGLLPDDYTFLPEDGGVHTFTVTLQTPGPQTLKVTDVANSFHTDSAVVNVEGPATASQPDAMGWALSLGQMRASLAAGPSHPLATPAGSPLSYGPGVRSPLDVDLALFE